MVLSHWFTNFTKTSDITSIAKTNEQRTDSGYSRYCTRPLRVAVGATAAQLQDVQFP